ncbi:MAG: hypothetical protein KGL39_10405 [Patescibacteria group bacterium]|nr:hypothetical protein [Patescibacteria group bacterium]
MAMLRKIKRALGFRKERETNAPPAESSMEYGLMKKSFTFNTVTADKISPNLMASISTHDYSVRPKDIRFCVTPEYLMKNVRMFDPRTPKGIPEPQMVYWFYPTSDGKQESVLSTPLSQGSCGSCSN